MTERICLKGITWNHPRGYESIGAVSKAFSKKCGNVEFHWDTRSLKDFGDYPVTLLAEGYDLIMLDHPHIGSAVKSGALIPLEQWLDEAFLEDQEKNSVGRSFESYQMNGHQWALAVDAAAQTSAYRPDLMGGVLLPGNWEEVKNLAKDRGRAGRVGFPLCQTDVYCSFLSICANIQGDRVICRESGLELQAALQAVDLLRELSEMVSPVSLDMNPIQMLEYMALTNEVCYVPLLFGYSNYARTPAAGRKLIRFANIPSFTEIPSGSLLGGVGLAVSARCRYKKIAADFVRFAAQDDIQRGIYYENAGQPGYLGAWTDEKVNRDCHGFFLDTLDTLRLSYLRPRYEGYNQFQERAGLILKQGLKDRQKPKEIVGHLQTLYEKLEKQR